MDRDQLLAIARIAESTGGAITGDQLRALGASPTEIRGLVARGALHRVRRDHFLVGHRNVSRIALFRSLVLQAGAGAALSAAAAVECWGFLPWRARVIDIAVPRRRRPIDGARLRVRSRLVEHGGTTHCGVAILSPEHAVLALAEDLTPTAVVRVIREGSYRRVLDIDRLASLAGYRGVCTLRAALEQRATGSHGLASSLERAVARALPRDVLVGSVPNYDVDVGTEVLRVDRVWPEERICLEIDGPPHDEPDQQRIDRIRTAALTVIGFVVVRVHWNAFGRDPARALDPIITTVRQARSD